MVDVLKIQGEWSLIDALLNTGLVSSRAEARRLSKQGAIRLDDVKLPAFFEPFVVDIYVKDEGAIVRERYIIEENKLIEICKLIKEKNKGMSW